MSEFWMQALVLAFVFDIIIGEPPAVIHPVVWMGKLVTLFVEKAPQNHRKLYGFLMALSCIVLVAVAGVLISKAVTGLAGLLIAAYFLKSTFSIRMLLVSALGIKKDLEAGDIGTVRENLKTFVGRDTSNLDEHQSASAVIESVAESFVDAILSPLFYFLLFGLPGALVYRMINTLDSTVGYRKEPFIELGYASAKMDDIANWVPARMSLVFIFVASIFAGSPVSAARTCIRDHNRTASPNSGWSMAAVSGAVRVRLEKVGYHVLGHGFGTPEPEHIKKVVNVVALASVIVVGVVWLVGIIPFYIAL
ncbi:MAG: cobalamin biosynthesis protein [Candidatus Methanoperedens sp.]